jgi:hypothetical protein
MRLILFLFFLIGISISCRIDPDHNQMATDLTKATADSIESSNNKKKDIRLITWEELSNNPRLVNFHFESYYLYLAGTLSDEIYKPSTLQVVIPISNFSQILDLSFYGILWWNKELEPFIKKMDINLDDHDDLMLLDNAGATGNNWYHVWLYDSIRNRFVYNDDYSGISALKVSKDKKWILSYYRMGNDEETLYYYIPNRLLKPILIRKEYPESDKVKNNSFTWKVTATIINGRWTILRKDTMKNSLYFVDYLNK